MKNFFVVLFILLMSFSVVKADDSGFRYNFGFTLSSGFSLDNVNFYYELNNDITYLFPILNLEIGIGADYLYKQDLTGKSFYRTVTLPNGDTSNIGLSKIQKRNLIPEYIVVRYNLDIFEDGYVVFDFKYGIHSRKSYNDTIYTTISYLSDPNDGTSYDRSYFTQYSTINNFKYYSFSVGYQLDEILIALDYKLSTYSHSYTLVGDDSTLPYNDNKNIKSSFVGIRFLKTINLF